MTGNLIFCIYKMFANERYPNKGRDAKVHLIVYYIIAYIGMVVLTSSLAFAGKEPLYNQTAEKGFWPAFWIMFLQGMI